MLNQYYHYFDLAKIGSVGHVQQKIKLPSPYICSYYRINSEQLLIPVFEVYFTLRNLGF